MKRTVGGIQIPGTGVHRNVPKQQPQKQQQQRQHPQVKCRQQHLYQSHQIAKHCNKVKLDFPRPKLPPLHPLLQLPAQPDWRVQLPRF